MSQCTLHIPLPVGDVSAHFESYLRQQYETSGSADPHFGPRATVTVARTGSTSFSVETSTEFGVPMTSEMVFDLSGDESGCNIEVTQTINGREVGTGRTDPEWQQGVRDWQAGVTSFVTNAVREAAAPDIS